MQCTRYTACGVPVWRGAQEREARVQAQPEYDIPENLVALDDGHAADRDEWNLDQLHRKEVRPRRPYISHVGWNGLKNQSVCRKIGKRE